MKKHFKYVLTIFFIFGLINYSYAEEYNFEAVIEAINKIAGEPFQNLNMNGMKSVSYMFKGEFDEVEKVIMPMLNSMGVKQIDTNILDENEQFKENMRQRNTEFEEFISFHLGSAKKIHIIFMDTNGVKVLMVQDIDDTTFGTNYKQ